MSPHTNPEWPLSVSLQITNAGEGVEKRESSYTIGKNVNWRTAWRFLKKPKTELPYEPAIPLLGIYLDKTIIQNDTSSQMFTVMLFRIECPLLDEWIKKMWYVYTHTMEYYSAIKRMKLAHLQQHGYN